jgi:hypothetical protein
VLGRIRWPGYPKSRAARLAATAGMTIAITITGTAMAGGAAAQNLSVSRNQPAVPSASFPAPLSGLACRSLTDCVAVGANFPQMATALVAERWNGTRWSRSAMPAPAGAANVSPGGVACPAARQCVAVGGAYPLHTMEYAIANYWNGSRWSVGRTADPGVFSTLSAVSCPAQGNCYAAGSYMPKNNVQDPLIEHWNGSGWRQDVVPIPRSKDNFAILTDISCPTAAFCVAVGETGTVAFVERWNGQKWTETTPPLAAGALLSGVSCPAVTSCFAVGFGASGNRSLVEQWNGTKWSGSDTPGPAAANSVGLQDVSCVSHTQCLAVGNRFNGGVYAVSWNGHGWHLVGVAATGGKLGAFGQLRCLSATSCVALAGTTAFAASTRSESAFWNGKAWKIVLTA